MNKKELLINLDQNISLTIKFINEMLYPRNEVDHSKLNEYTKVLKEFQKNNNLTILYKLSEISSRADIEGSDTDYTEGTSLNFDGKYTSLRGLLLNIEDLIFEIEKI